MRGSEQRSLLHHVLKAIQSTVDLQTWQSEFTSRSFCRRCSLDKDTYVFVRVDFGDRMTSGDPAQTTPCFLASDFFLASARWACEENWHHSYATRRPLFGFALVGLSGDLYFIPASSWEYDRMSKTSMHRSRMHLPLLHGTQAGDSHETGTAAYNNCSLVGSFWGDSLHPAGNFACKSHFMNS